MCNFDLSFLKCQILLLNTLLDKVRSRSQGNYVNKQVPSFIKVDIIMRKRRIWNKAFLLDAIYLFSLQRNYLYFSIEKRQLIGITSSGNVFYPTEYTSSNNLTTLNWHILIPVFQYTGILEQSLSVGLPHPVKAKVSPGGLSSSKHPFFFI